MDRDNVHGHMWLGLNYNFHENRVLAASTWEELALFLLFAWKWQIPLLRDANQSGSSHGDPICSGPTPLGFSGHDLQNG